MAYADDPGWTDEMRALRDAPASTAVLDGVVAVLSRWRKTWGERPIAIVPMPSHGHGRLVRSIAEHLGSVGKLDVVDALAMSGSSIPPDASSGAKVKALLTAMGLRPGVVVPRGPVLLLDALYRSGWTMTVGAALLRDAGATNVLPLAVHQLP